MIDGNNQDDLEAIASARSAERDLQNRLEEARIRNAHSRGREDTSMQVRDYETRISQSEYVLRKSLLFYKQ
jgi:hypothetical protein